LQFEHNYAVNATTGQSPNRVIIGFNTNNTAKLFLDDVQDETLRQQLLPTSRVAVSDAIALASMTMKHYHDKRRQPKYFNVGDRVLLRLHKGYSIPTTAATGMKLSQKYAGPFRVIERIGQLAYRLDFSKDVKIHNVISVDHLEPNTFDVFGRQLPPAGPIRASDHEVDRIIATRTTRGGIQYLIHYKDLGNEFDEWISEQDSKVTPDLVRAFTKRRSTRHI